MSGILNLMRLVAGLYVLKKAQMIDTVTINRNSFCGNVSGVGIPTNILLCIVILHPTQVPIATPEKDEDSTRIKASYMKSLVMTPLVKPMDLMTEISLHCSYRLPVIDEDSEKKQMNIVMEITTLKIISRVDSA